MSLLEIQGIYPTVAFELIFQVTGMLGVFLIDQEAELWCCSDTFGFPWPRKLGNVAQLDSSGEVFWGQPCSEGTAPESWTGLLGFSISLVSPEELFLLAPQCSHTKTLPETLSHWVGAAAQSMGEGMRHVGPQQSSWISSLHTGSAHSHPQRPVEQPQPLGLGFSRLQWVQSELRLTPSCRWTGNHCLDDLLAIIPLRESLI